VSVFGRAQRPEGPSADPADDYLFFLADPKHPGYTLVQNVVRGQMDGSEFRLTDHPVTPADVLHTGKAAWDAALATVNVGKVQLAWASSAIAEHAFIEAIRHSHRGCSMARVSPTFRTCAGCSATPTCDWWR
jgi:acyl-CoA dehydrogenase